jgi:rhodanese-related sulfurtransferase
MQQLNVRQLAEWLADASRPQPMLLDVREPSEFELCHLPGSQLIPMHTIPMRCEELPTEQEIVVICHHGGRSMQVAMFLERRGFANVINLSGGVDSWAIEIDHSMHRY